MKRLTLLLSLISLNLFASEVAKYEFSLDTQFLSGAIHTQQVTITEDGSFLLKTLSTVIVPSLPKHVEEVGELELTIEEKEIALDTISKLKEAELMERNFFPVCEIVASPIMIYNDFYVLKDEFIKVSSSRSCVVGDQVYPADVELDKEVLELKDLLKKLSIELLNK